MTYLKHTTISGCTVARPDNWDAMSPDEKHRSEYLQNLSTFSRSGHRKNIEALKALAIKNGMVGTITIRYSVLDLSGKGRSSDADEIKVTL